MGSRNIYPNKCFLRDRKIGKTYKFGWHYHDYTGTLITHLKDRFPTTNFIGIRVLVNRDAKSFIRLYYNDAHYGYSQSKEYDRIINDWKNKNIKKTKNTFITVMTEAQLLRKGADLIIEVAVQSPNCKFYFAGIDGIKYRATPNNIICLGRLTPKELKSWYSKTQFYLQLSNFEGFGVALCEAMLCKCIPIVSRVNFLPNIIGDSGFVLDNRNISELKQIINTVQKTDLVSLMDKVENRILDNFSGKNRKKILIKELEKLS